MNMTAKYPRVHLTKALTEELRRVADGLGRDLVYPLPDEAKGYGKFPGHVEGWQLGRILGDLLDEVVFLRAVVSTQYENDKWQRGKRIDRTFAEVLKAQDQMY